MIKVILITTLVLSIRWLKQAGLGQYKEAMRELVRRGWSPALLLLLSVSVAACGGGGSSTSSSTSTTLSSTELYQ